MNICSFIIHFHINSVCSKVYVEYIIGFGELEELSFSFSSSLLLVPLDLEASPSTKKLKRAAALRVSNTLTLWAPKNLDFLVTPIENLQYPPPQIQTPTMHIH